MSLTKLGIFEMEVGLKAKEFTATELVEEHIKESEAKKNLNVFSVETFDIARQQAKESDKRIADGNARKMEGIPVGVKDLYCTNGVTSTACSNILKGFIPTYESTVSQKLKDSGAVMIGKTSMDEFAMGSANINGCNGPVINPWKRKSDDKDLVPGGSSGGSSAAVAANVCAGALGSDTGGSIRQPASFTGTFGIKPTYGRCSRWGMIAFASSLDQAGVFTRNVRDGARMLETICGHDKKDSTSVDMSIPNFEEAVKQGVKGKKIGIPKEYMIDGISDEIVNLWDKGKEILKDAGAEIVHISLPHTKYSLPAYYILAPAEASSNLARYDGVRYGNREIEQGDSLDDMYERTREFGFGAEVKRRIIIGTYVLSSGYIDAYYKKAQRVRALISRDFKEAFFKVDAILTPSTPTGAFAIEEAGTRDPVEMYLNDVFTVPASLAGLPCSSVPVDLSSDGLPLGLHIIGKPFDEEAVFSVSRALEKSAEFNGIKSIY